MCDTSWENTKHNTHCDCTSHDMSVVRTILFLGIITHGILATEEDKEVYRAIVESCGGWRLNRLPEVKRFIYEDLPLFHNVEFKKVGGAPPELILIGKGGEELERIELEHKNREECNQLLTQRGFYKKSEASEEVPEEFRQGPYKLKEEL